MRAPYSPALDCRLWEGAPARVATSYGEIATTVVVAAYDNASPRVRVTQTRVNHAGRVLHARSLPGVDAATARAIAAQLVAAAEVVERLDAK